MKTDATNEVLAFQAWLSQSIRRAWILAFAVAVPGAFLVTWWFPKSPQAVAAVALIGIAIGICVDGVKDAKARRRDELVRVTTELHQTIQDAIEKIVAEISSQRKVLPLGSHLSEIQTTVDGLFVSNQQIVKEVKSLQELLLVLFKTSPRRAEESSSQMSPLITHYLGNPPYAAYWIAGESVRAAGRIFDLSAEVRPLLWIEAPQYRDILIKIERMAQERGIPVSGFLQQLYYIASSTNILARLQKQREEAR